MKKQSHATLVSFSMVASVASLVLFAGSALAGDDYRGGQYSQQELEALAQKKLEWNKYQARQVKQAEVDRLKALALRKQQQEEVLATKYRDSYAKQLASQRTQPSSRQAVDQQPWDDRPSALLADVDLAPRTTRRASGAQPTPVALRASVTPVIEPEPMPLVQRTPRTLANTYRTPKAAPSAAANQYDAVHQDLLNAQAMGDDILDSAPVTNQNILANDSVGESIRARSQKQRTGKLVQFTFQPKYDTNLRGSESIDTRRAITVRAAPRLARAIEPSAPLSVPVARVATRPVQQARPVQPVPQQDDSVTQAYALRMAQLKAESELGASTPITPVRRVPVAQRSRFAIAPTAQRRAIMLPAAIIAKAQPAPINRSFAAGSGTLAGNTKPRAAAALTRITSSHDDLESGSDLSSLPSNFWAVSDAGERRQESYKQIAQNLCTLVGQWEGTVEVSWSNNEVSRAATSVAFEQAKDGMGVVGAYEGVARGDHFHGAMRMSFNPGLGKVIADTFDSRTNSLSQFAAPTGDVSNSLIFTGQALSDQGGKGLPVRQITRLVSENAAIIEWFTVGVDGRETPRMAMRLSRASRGQTVAANQLLTQSTVLAKLDQIPGRAPAKSVKPVMNWYDQSRTATVPGQE